jgi:hypothetical protein
MENAGPFSVRTAATAGKTDTSAAFSLFFLDFL